MEKQIYTSNPTTYGSDELSVKTCGVDCYEFTIDSPSSGSTEEGFGAELSITLKRHEVEKLVSSLLTHLNTVRG